MRITLVSHTYVTAMSQKKAQALAREVDHLTVIVPEVLSDALRTIRAERMPGAEFELKTIRSLYNGHAALRAYHPLDLRKALMEAKPDILLLEQEPYTLNAYQVLRLKKALGCKAVIFSFQNIYKKYPPPFSWIERFSLKKSDHFIGGSAGVLPVWVKKGFGPDRMSVIPQVGVDSDEFKPLDRSAAKSRLGLKGFTIGYAGRIVEEKGIAVLVDAFKKASLPNATTLVLFGRGPFLSSVLQQAKNLGISDRIQVFQSISHEQMPQALNALDILVLPSLERPHWREQFGHVLIEAMACEIPAVGSDREPIRDVIGPGGLTFSMGSVDELARVLSSLSGNDSERVRLGQLGRKHVMENYTNTVIVKKLRKLFDQLSLS